MTTTPGSNVIGDLGVSPIAVTAVTGFGLALDGTGTFATTSGSSNVVGSVYGASLTASTPAYLTAAVGDMGIAYLDAAGRVNPDFVDRFTGNLEGQTLARGLYKWNGNVAFINSVTFSGSPTDIWILQIAGSFVVGSGASVVLEGGALAENIFWQVAGLVDIGTNAHLEGTFLVFTMMAFNTGAA